MADLEGTPKFSHDKGIIEEKLEKDFPWWKIWKRRRYVVSILAFIGFFNIYSLRSNLSVAIIAMVENRTITLENGTTIYEQEFDWNSSQTGVLLSAFFWGYITTQLIGGILAERYGGKKLFGFGVFTTAVLTLFTPLVAKQSYAGLLALRIIEGIFEGVTYPSIHSVWARWAPPLERSRLATFAFAGSYVGAVVSLTLSGVIGDTLGWESIFYIFGVFATLWFFCWCFLIAESPSEDRFISKEELDYISKSLNKNDEDNRKVKHPWKEILTSMPFWAITCSNFSENWGFNTLLTQLPTFMNDVLNFNLTASGSLSALPYLAMSICTMLSGFLADMCLKRKYLNTTQVRKIFNCGAFISQTVFMLGAAFLMSAVGSTICLTLAVGLGGFALSGYGVNYLDIGPSHASVLMGISNTFATIPGMVSPTITGLIVQNGTADEWRIIFYIAAGIYLIGCIIYGCFASGKLQSWSLEAKLLKKNGGENNQTYVEDNDNVAFSENNEIKKI
ncbi:sialin-like [Agrilus planipennis]|uniref:Sialin n=1 Tax=Agrilus planipennis TaxID=224129 RepID=A0A7F5RAN5_AGRPL|nr:sialin-like [Agrilus planipennis]